MSLDSVLDIGMSLVVLFLVIDNYKIKNHIGMD